MNAIEYRQTLDKAQGRKEFIQSNIEKRKKSQLDLEHKLEIIEQAQVLVQAVAVETQNKIKFHFEKVIQMALDICFPGEYEFQMEFKVNANKTECRLMFLKDDQEESPEDESGGGLLDILAFVFRVACLSLGDTRSTLLLDEPFSALSRDLHHKAGTIIQQLSKELNVQVIMSTHNPDMEEYADRVFKVSAKKHGEYKESVIEVVK
jgi:ABC-type lipoprotein export system ATPase subunit